MILQTIIIIAFYFSSFISTCRCRKEPALPLVLPSFDLLAGLDKMLRFIAYLSLVKLSCTKLTVGKVILVMSLASAGSAVCMEGGH